MLKFAVPAVAALGLIAYAAQSQATNSAVQTAGTPMGWHLSQEGEIAKLAYGVENSDQLALMMTCEKGQAQVVVFGDVRPATPHLIKASIRTAAIDPLSGAMVDEARVLVSDPAMQSLVRNGKLQVEGDAGRFELAATVAERRLVRDFFAYCGSDRM